MKRVAVGILAHVDSGKTTLSEAMLYESGSISRLGRVDRRDSFLDTFSLERSRGITIFSKQAVFRYGDTEFTLIDTPGHVDFSAEAERTLQVLDYAVLVISATDGVQSHTQTLWRLLKKYDIPCFIFVNKMDMEPADKGLALEGLKKRLSEGCVDFSSRDEGFFESIALCDEALLDKYEESSIGREDIISAIQKRRIFPCFFGSALRLDGVNAFMKGLDEYTAMPEYPEKFGARVYKISEDKGQRLTHMKITGGTLRVKDVLDTNNDSAAEKVNQIRIYSGDKYTAVNEATAGMICAVTGISHAASGDGLGSEASAIMPVLEPVMLYTINLPDGVDEHTVLEKMKILESEDPQLNVEWSSRLGEIQIKLMGSIQLEILQSIIAERFGLEVSFSRGSIIYKETIADTVEGIGHFEPLRHYAEVHLLMKPTERNSGITFRTDCKEDVLDKNWQRLILTHLYEKTHIGVLTGSPITDMEITLKSGKAHPKHTEGGDFRQATYRAVRQGLRSAKSILLEPVYEFSLEIPDECVGRALNDIQLMHGTFNPPEKSGEATIITGSAPVATMHDYTMQVMQYTHGRGRLSCSLKGYEPCHNADEVIARAGYDCDADTENTCDSVFCSHGSGYNVKWNEVKSHMHLPSVLSKPKSKAEGYAGRAYASTAGRDDLFALDKELMEIFEQTYGPIKSRSNPEQRHFTFTKAKEKSDNPRKPAVKYDGKEYLLVDGYNVIFSWDSLRELSRDNIEGARNALINILCNYQGYRGCEVILVFDAYRVKGNSREVEKINNISVVYTKEAETADMYIEKATHELAGKSNRVRVVTSDALEQIIILGNGALRVSAREFLDEIHSAEEHIREIIESKK